VGAAKDGNPVSFLKIAVSELDQKQKNESVPRSGRNRAFATVPTHAVGVACERRRYARAALRLPLQIRRVAGQAEAARGGLVTRDISSSGVYFLCPERIEPGTPIEVEIGIINRPFGRGSVRMRTEAHIVRVDALGENGWHGLAAAFDDITFYRDEALPSHFHDS
jgi:hypothetical protein